jgi:deoxyribodipyrimidine photolyase
MRWPEAVAPPFCPSQGGGETVALARLHDYAVARHLIGRYDDTRNQLLGEALSTAFVYANMRELAATSFMSNRGRQSVASYLIHGLHQDWRWGAACFENQLIGHDPALSWGNWKYLADTDVRSTVFDVPQQARPYDPKGKCVRTWLRA